MSEGPKRFPEDALSYEEMERIYPSGCSDGYLRSVLFLENDLNKQAAFNELIRRATDYASKHTLQFVRYKMHEHSSSLTEQSREDFLFYSDVLAGIDPSMVLTPKLPPGHCCKNFPHTGTFWGKKHIHPGELDDEKSG